MAARCVCIIALSYFGQTFYPFPIQIAQIYKNQQIAPILPTIFINKPINHQLAAAPPQRATGNSIVTGILQSISPIATNKP